MPSAQHTAWLRTGACVCEVIPRRLRLTQLPAICEVGGDGEEVALLWHDQFSGVEIAVAPLGIMGDTFVQQGPSGRQYWVHF